MTDIETQQHSGIRARQRIGWLDFGRFAAPVTLSPKRFEAQDEASDATLIVQRPFQGEGFPNIRQKDSIGFKWSDIREPVSLESLGMMSKMMSPVNVCVWKHDYEIWNGDGSRTTFYFRRRDAISSGLTPLPTSTADFPPRLLLLSQPLNQGLAITTEYSVANGNLVYQDTATINGGDPSAGQAWIEAGGHAYKDAFATTVKIGDVPPDATDILALAYIPLYYVVIAAVDARSFAAGNGEQQPEGRTFVEI